MALPPCHVTPAEVHSAQEWRQQHPSWLYSAVLSGHLRDHGAPHEHRYHRDHQVPRDLPLTLDELNRLPWPFGDPVDDDPDLAALDFSPFADELPDGEHPAFVARTQSGTDRDAAAVLFVAGTAPITTWDLPAMQDDTADPTWLGRGSDGSVSLVMTDFRIAQDPWGATAATRHREEHTPLWRRLLGRS